MPKISLVQKKIIISLLYGYYDILSIYFARIYTLGKENKFWLYSGLEGALVYCIDIKAKVLRFLLFNLKTYEIVFDCELYKKFNLEFQKGNDTFYFFGINDGYIGLEIPDISEALNLGKNIAAYNDDFAKKKLKEIKLMRENEIKEKGLQMIKLLKQKFNNNLNQPIKSEVVINQNELEKSFNTIEVDEKNQKLILTGTGYVGIDKELKKVRGLRIEENNIIEEDDIFSKYLARNILGSWMRNIIVPRRKIDRDVWGEGDEGELPEEAKKKKKKKEKKEKKEKKGKKDDKKNSINLEEEPEEIINEIEEPKNEIIIPQEKESIQPPPQPPPSDITENEKKLSLKDVNLDEESENKNIIILNQEEEKEELINLNKQEDDSIKKKIIMKEMIMAKRDEIKKGSLRENINKNKSESKQIIIQNIQSNQNQENTEESKKEEEKRDKIKNNPIEEKALKKIQKNKNTKQKYELIPTPVKVIRGKDKTIPPAPPIPPHLKFVSIIILSSPDKQIELNPEPESQKNNLLDLDMIENELLSLSKKNQEEDKNAINTTNSNNINMKAMILEKRSQMKKVGEIPTSLTNPSMKLNSSLKPKNPLNKPEIIDNNNPMYKSLTVEPSINSPLPQKPPLEQKNSMEIKNQNRVSLIISNLNKKPEKKIEEVKQPIRTGNNFAYKLAAIQAKMESRGRYLSYSTINQDYNINRESKPIVELCQGNTKNIDVKEVIKKLDKDKDKKKKKKEKKVKIKVICGKGKGIPPCPPPPPPPKFDFD